MSELNYAKAILLGVIQGLTEFLPISSSGHLALTQRWLGLDPQSTTLHLFDIFSHVGTLLAVGIVFAASARRLFKSVANETLGRSRSKDERPKRNTGLRILSLGVMASVATALVGIPFQDQFESAFDRPNWIGAALVVTGIFLIFSKRMLSKRGSWWSFGFLSAFVVGLAQGCAIMPGISRSGATICVASLLGLRRRWAAEFSFMIAVPAILGAAVMKIRETAHIPEEAFNQISWSPIVVGSLAAFVVGWLALKVLLHIVRKAKLHVFAWYCWLLGLSILVWNFTSAAD